jgi:hypothetical protein
MERRQAQAVQFTRDVVGDPDLADEIEGLSTQEYAERKRLQLANPKKRKAVKNYMAQQTEQKLDELAQKVDSLIEAIKSRGTEAGSSRSKPARLNPRVPSFSRLSQRAKNQMLDEREEILDALEEAQDALDECRYDEAQEILDEILGQHETEGEEDEEES